MLWQQTKQMTTRYAISAPFPARVIVDSERPSMASMASMASLASLFAKAKTGSHRLHGEKSKRRSDRPDAIQEPRGG